MARWRARGRGFASALIATIALCGHAARAEDAVVVGRAALVENDVRAEVAGVGPRRLAVDDDVVFQEVIQAAADSRAVIEFRDGATLDIGPNALVTIDRFVFNPAESMSERQVTVVRGVFRYISGAALPGQRVRIQTPAGTIGIRGSVVLGAVGDDIPTFVHVAQGNARFENAAGVSDLTDDQSIAVANAATVPMRAADMPPALAAESLGAIQRRLLPPARLRGRVPPSERRLLRDGENSLAPAAEQLARQPGAGGPVAARGASGIAGEVPLLRSAGAAGLLAGNRGALTPAQQGMLRSLRARDAEGLRAIRAFGTEHRTLQRFNTERGVASVMGGVGRAAPNREVLAAAAGNTARGNPGFGPAITRTALAAYRHPDRTEAARAVAGRIADRGRGSAAGGTGAGSVGTPPPRGAAATGAGATGAGTSAPPTRRTAAERRSASDAARTRRDRRTGVDPLRDPTAPR